MVSIKYRGGRQRRTPALDHAVAAIREEAHRVAGLPMPLLPSERELALRLGASRKTVRDALDRLNLEGLISGTDGTRCRLVVGCSGHDSVLADTVVLLSVTDPNLPEDVGSEGWERFVDVGAMEAVRSAGLHLLVLNPAALGLEGFRRCVGGKPFGILCTRRVEDLPEWNAMLATIVREACPVVLFGNRPEFSRFDRVTSDQRDGGYQLATFLARLGYRRLLQVWPDAASRTDWKRDREQGYADASAAGGLPLLSPLVMPALDSSVLPPEALLRMQAGYLAERFATDGLPDAILAVSDGEALSISAALAALGHDHIPVAGYDHYWEPLVAGTPGARPPIATIDKDNRAIGHAMAALLRERRQGNPKGAAPRHVVIAPRLVPTTGWHTASGAPIPAT